MARVILVFALTLFSLNMVESVSGLTLSSGGKTDYVIVLPRDAIPAEQRAAKELASFLQQIGGATFPIVDDTASLPRRAILLGNNTHLASLGVAPDWRKLGKEGFLLQTKGQHLIIAGGRPRGTMYGVYAFLEEKLGCRWYTSKISKIPRMETITVPDLNETQVPALEYREPFNTDGFDPDWAARNRCNSATARLTEEHGGKITFIPFVHSFYQLIPPAVYFKDHPEFFSEINGQRTADHAQLCLTNPAVVKLMVEKVREIIQKNPQVSIVDVSQNDWRGNCQCARCKAIDEAEGSPSGSLLSFVNAVAEEIGKEFPDVAIETLAYQYTRKPPKTIRPRPNVIIRLCSIECDFGQPLATGERNRSFAEDIRGWHQICDRLYIWDYITSFSHYLVPFPNLHNLGPNVRFFVENGVKGIFAEGNYSPGGGGENNELRNYMLAKLMWNPNIDDNAVRWDFLSGVYGPAAKPILEYQRLLEQAVTEKNVAVPCWFSPDAAIFTDELIKKAEDLFDQAEAAVKGNEELLLRVRHARMPIDYVVLCQTAGQGQGVWKLTEKRFAPEVPKLVSDACSRFFATAKAVGVESLNEGGHGRKPSQVEEFYKQVGVALTGADVEWINGKRFTAAIVPDLGCRVVAVREKGSAANTPGNRLIFSPSTPLPGGVAACSEMFFKDMGLTERFILDAEKKEFVATLPNGLKVGRSFLPEDEGFSFVTRVTNEGKEQPVQASVRSLVCLSGEVKVVGAFGEKVLPPLSAGAPGNLVISAAEVAGQPVRIASSEGTSVTIGIAGPCRALSIGLGPDGLVSVAVGFDLPSLRSGESTQWKLTIRCSGSSAGAKPTMPGVVEAQDDVLSCYREGTLSGRRPEATASDGSVGYIIGSTNEWALQWRYPAALFLPGRKYDVLAVVRIIGTGEQVPGVGMTYGVYSVPKKAGKGGGELRDEANRPGQWQTVRVATVIPESGDYVWFAPAKNEAVQEIQVDRILMVPVSGG